MKGPLERQCRRWLKTEATGCESSVTCECNFQIIVDEALADLKSGRYDVSRRRGRGTEKRLPQGTTMTLVVAFFDVLDRLFFFKETSCRLGED